MPGLRARQGAGAVPGTQESRSRRAVTSVKGLGAQPQQQAQGISTWPHPPQSSNCFLVPPVGQTQLKPSLLVESVWVGIRAAGWCRGRATGGEGRPRAPAHCSSSPPLYISPWGPAHIPPPLQIILTEAACRVLCSQASLGGSLSSILTFPRSFHVPKEVTDVLGQDLYLTLWHLQSKRCRLLGMVTE